VDSGAAGSSIDKQLAQQLGVKLIPVNPPLRINELDDNLPDPILQPFGTHLTLVPQVILGLITYSREELLNIRATSTHHHYDQEYDFPEADPVFCPPPRTMDRIPASEPKQRCHIRGRRGALLVRLRRWAPRAPLPSILLANVQSLDNNFRRRLRWPPRFGFLGNYAVFCFFTCYFLH
jgi:hypothetical protein